MKRDEVNEWCKTIQKYKEDEAEECIIKKNENKKRRKNFIKI